MEVVNSYLNNCHPIQIYVWLGPMSLVSSQSATLSVEFGKFDVLVMETIHMGEVVNQLDYYINYWKEIQITLFSWDLIKSVLECYKICTHLVGEGLEQLIMFVGRVTCSGFVKSELASLLNDQCSASKVKSGEKMVKFINSLYNYYVGLIVIHLPSSD